VSFWRELRRRNVFRVGIAYLAATWLIIQVAETVLVTFDAPAWVMQALIAVSALAFPFVLVLAWVYEWTPEGIKVTPEAGESDGPPRRPRIFDIAIIAVMALAIVVLVVDNYVLEGDATTADDAVLAGGSACMARAGSPAPSIVPLTFDGGNKRRPRISPDGRMVAFTWYHPPNFDGDVYLKQIGRNTGSIRITDHSHFDGEPSWSPDGEELAFVRDEDGDAGASIYVAPSLGGPARKIVDFETSPFYGGMFLGAVTWSPNRPSLVYPDRASADAPSRIIELDRNTGAKRELSTPPTVPDALGDFEPVFAPSGDRIAFVRGATSLVGLDIWVMDADGGNERQITGAQWAQLHTLSWTADGEALLFTAGRGPYLRSYCVSLSEGVPRPLPGLGEGDQYANVAEDRVVYVRRNFDLAMWQAPGRVAGSLDASPLDLNREGVKIVFSPSGNQIAWQSHRTGSPQVWIADRDGSGARALTDQEQYQYALNPQWSQDGTQIAFYSWDAGNADVYVIDVDSGRARRITTDRAEDRYPSFSHDGRWLYFSSNRSGRSEIYRMPAEGGDAVRVTETGGTIAFESHDGRYLYYEYLDGNNGYTTRTNPVWRIAVDGGRDAEEVLPGWQRAENSWVLGPSGIYYVRVVGQGADTEFSFRYLDLGSGDDAEILSGSGRIDYPGVSPDEETVFYTRTVPEPGELYLLENFR
jgi:Tol biopolymer transport system component